MDKFDKKEVKKCTMSANTNHEIEVSIIIPSQNKYPLNLYSLYSLEYQSFNPKKMEVIFINDASTDQTDERLKNYHPPYHFQYIHSTQKLGRARVRNLGVQSARGNIIIFLDAEMITEPDFVENHYNYHLDSKNVIVSGAMYSKALYSCIFSSFSQEQINKLGKLAKNNQQFYQRLNKCQFPLNKPFPLLDKKDIETGTFKVLSFNAYPWFEQITTNFNELMEGFSFPWMAFLTGNLSMRKEFIMEAGLFDDEFFHYGYEDWELGYRLYKMGAKYLISNKMVTYHQEHPVEERKWKEAVGNFGLFALKHRDIDVLILCIELARMADLVTMNNILKEYKSLLTSNPDKYESFSDKFIYILETIFLMLEVDIRHFNLLGAAGFSTQERKEFQKDIKQIKKLKKYPNLTEFLKKVYKS
ncbi:glycosyltransferase family 2 protein [Neobacillus cucumis]|nr:glycosyltransferase [Neobacillus cucumis]